MIINALIKDCDFQSTKDFEVQGLCNCEAEFGKLCYHMDYELFPAKIECSLTVLMHSQIDNDWHEVNIETRLKDELEKQFKSRIESLYSELLSTEDEDRALEAYRYECNGLDPAFRSWEEVNRMFYTKY